MLFIKTVPIIHTNSVLMKSQGMTLLVQKQDQSEGFSSLFFLLRSLTSLYYVEYNEHVHLHIFISFTYLEHQVVCLKIKDLV